MFMLGETAETRGLFLGCGMNSVGLASGGGAGMNLAHCIVHGRTAYDLSEADAQRFAPVFNSVEHLMARAPEILGTHYEITYPGRQLKTARGLRKMALHDAYAAAGAAFGQVYGWERPLYFNKASVGQEGAPQLSFGRPDWFEQVGREVEAAHQRAALFDASCFGKIEVQGPEACAFLQWVCAANMDKPAGSAIYTALLTEQGTYASDITAQRITDQHYRLFVGTNAIKRDLAWLRRHAEGYDVALTDSTEDYAVLGLMGPEAGRILRDCGAPELLELGYFKLGPAHIAGKHVRAVRLSYVGEAGFEITAKWENAAPIYAALTAAGAEPAGLYAQTSMRIEKGFAAMGHELDSDVSPVETGLAGLASRRKDYLGKAGLEQRRSASKPSLATLIFDDPQACPLGHEPLVSDGQIIGTTSSAAFGYRLGRPVALAHLKMPNPEASWPSSVEVLVTGKRWTARVQAGAAFDPEGRRMKGALL